MNLKGLRLVATLAGGYAGFRAMRRTSAGLNGQVALVAGGSRGLGLLLAREFSAQGCKVAICARDHEELEKARQDLTARGAQVFSRVCDLTDRAQVGTLVTEVERALGPVGVLVNNAAIIQVGPLETMTIEDFEEAMAAAFWSALYTTYAVLPGMRARRSGRIVNVASIGGRVSVPHLLPYGCAKFALVGLSEGLRAELAGSGVSVTTIVPGLMRTGSAANAFFKGQQDLEFSWFSLGAALPLTSIDAQHAARRIVRAAKDRRAELTLGWQARLARLAHGLAPGLVADALGLFRRLLPDAEGSGTDQARGMELSSGLSPSVLTALGNRAARDLNHFGGTPRPSPAHAAQAGLDPETIH